MTIFKKQGISLSQFVRGLVKALTDGQQAIPHAREEFFNHHMDVVGEEGQTRYKPKMLTVEISEGRYVTIPTYTLSHVNTIGITAAKIVCSARIVDMQTVEECGDMACGDKHVSFEVHPMRNGRNSFEMTLEFQQREPSESESRLIESLDSMVVESAED